MPPRNPIVIAYHVVWTAYGTWLPNDPRGSGSTQVDGPLLAELGEIHYGRKKLQPHPAIVRDFYDRAEPLLNFSIVRFDERQRQTIADAFAQAIAGRNYTCWACAIMPDHAHLVIRKHRDRAEAIISTLQEASRLRLSDVGAVSPGHPVWTNGGWKRFLDLPEAVRGVIHYIERNPAKSRLPPQRWGFVTPYDGWTFETRRR